MRHNLHPATPPRLLSYAAVGGAWERQGPLGEKFDYCATDDRFGCATWEEAEAQMSRFALSFALKKAGLNASALDLLAAGDLENQCVASSRGFSPLGIPFLGLFGACSTMIEGLIVATLALGGARELETAAVVTSSHNCAAERQFRTPLEYGAQRTPTAQWTATAAGAVLLGKSGRGPQVTAARIGRIVDGGVTDAANMGAAMAPAAADTLLSFLREEDAMPECILTGDLGREGSDLLCELLAKEGVELRPRHRDGGCLLYDFKTQDVHSGGSGCGCIASVLAADILPRLEAGELSSVLAVGTGALMSPDSLKQGASISGVAHAVRIEK